MKLPVGRAIGALRRQAAELLAAVFGLGWFLFNGGGPALDPTRIGWLLKGDWAQHLLGWLFFRREPWSFPLGRMESFAQPLGTAIGFTDSNPLLALLLKPIERLLPVDFQYVGAWMALCFALQGFVGAKLIGLFSKRPLARFLGGAFFAIAPVLLQRVGHDTLLAHWLLLGALWAALRPCACAAEARRTSAIAVGLVWLSAAIHPYLTAMSLPIALAAIARLGLERSLRWREVAVASCLLPLGALGLFAVLGYLDPSTPKGFSGFGHYSANLDALINPLGWSRLLPDLPVRGGQYEGYGYLGLGGLALIGSGLVAFLKIGPRAIAWRRALPLSVVCGLLFVFALSWTVAAGGKVVFEYRSLLEPLQRVIDPFRASGRFVWPLYYLLLAGAAALVLKAWPRASLAILGAVLALQLADLKPRKLDASGPELGPLRASEWQLMAGDYQRLVFVPPIFEWTGDVCPGADYRPGLYVPFAYQAYRNGLGFNGGYLARLDRERVRSYCREQAEQVEAGRFDPGAVYVVRPQRLGAFLRPERGMTCGRLDGHAVCVDGSRGTRLRGALERSRLGGGPQR